VDLVSVRALKLDEDLLGLVGDALSPTGLLVMFVSETPAIASRTGLKVDRTIALIPSLHSKALVLSRE
jgi:hypothetical protein